MAGILKIRNKETGEWESIPAIQGESGPEGKSLQVLDNGNIARWDDATGQWVDTGMPAAAVADLNGVPVAFTEAGERILPASGETVPTVFGKVLKWFKSLGKFAFATTIDWTNDVSGKPDIPTKSYIDDADSALGTRITEETSRAEEAEETLGSRIDTANSNLSATNARLDEVREIAEGAAKGIVFDTQVQMTDWLSGNYNRPDGLTPADLVIGQHLLIKEVDVPDYWWTGEAVSELETQKVDLSGYTTRQEMNDGLDGRVAKAGTSSASTSTVYARTNSGSAGTGTDALKPVSTGTTSGHIVMRTTSGNVSAPASVPLTNDYFIGAKQVKALLDAKLDAAFYDGYNTVTTLASVPVTKRSALANITAGGTLSLGGTLPTGKEMSIKARNAGSADITITFSNDAAWESRNTKGESIDSVTLPVGGSIEISVWALDKLIVKTDA